MSALWTFPDQKTLQKLMGQTPDYMRPNSVPCAVVAEGFLNADECDSLAEVCGRFPGYTHDGCGATTREIGHIPALDQLRDFGHFLNESFWNYILDVPTTTWLQTYSEGADYQLHMDGRPGQMRKLTAVVFLTHPKAYSGGALELFYHPQAKLIPRTQGTVVCFPPWILHKVSEVTRGQRQSLNIGYWGPNFK